MKFFIYSVFDRVAAEYGDIFLAKAEQLASRRFDFVMSQSKMVAADCALFCLGEYDSETGKISAYENPQFIKNFEVEHNG